ncbi:MAG TPA: helix-turn-helix domain-containing protein [Pirellulales bacterium]
MARKLIDQDEAAKLLGVSVEEINKMRDRKQLFPYRDGDAWKFKPEDIERLKQQLASGAGDSWTGGSEFGQPPPEPDSVLLSEKELGQSADTTSSTIIGKGGPHGPVTEGDIKLATPSPSESSASDLKLAAGTSALGSDVKLVLSGSDAKKQEAAKAEAKKADSHIDLGGLDELKLEPSGSGVIPGGSSKKGDANKSSGSGSFKLADDELVLSEGGSGSSKKKGSDSKKAGISDFSRSLELDDDVLGAKPDSDITRGAADSGIHLVDPKDSGLSLEEPLVLGTGSAKELLELGEADVISLEETADMEGATQLKSDEDFLLTPIQESTADESDSGSQVIALDSEEEMSSGAFTPATSGMVAMLEEDTGAAEGGLGLAPAGGIAGGPSLIAASHAAEAPFSGWNVTGLVCCAVLLLMTGMMMYDLTRNMWQFDSVGKTNVSIFESIEKTIGWIGDKP